MKTTITLPIAIPRIYQIYPPDAFAVQEKDAGGKMVWLQRLAHKVLTKYGHRPTATTNIIKTETIEVDGVIAALGAMLDRACEITGEIDFIAVVGAKEWMEIRQRGDIEIIAPYQAYRLPVPERLVARAQSYRLREMRGVEVLVISWHSGVTVIPRVALRGL